MATVEVMKTEPGASSDYSWLFSFDDQTSILTQTSLVYIADIDQVVPFTIKLILDDAIQSEIILDSFTIQWVDPVFIACSSTNAMLVTTPIKFTQSLDAISVTYPIQARNQVAIDNGDPDYCGGRTTSWASPISATYVSLVDTGTEDFDFIVQKPPTTVGIGSVFFTVLTYLTGFQTSATKNFTVEVEFTCSSAY